MIDLLLAMYPARWRRRYGEEFRAVLEARPLGPFDVADVLLGALDARLTPFRLPGMATTGGGHLMLLRMGGIGAVIGGAAWFVGIAGASAGGGGAWLGVMIIGNFGLLLALVGLSAFQAHRNPVLAWAAFAIPALGTGLAVIGSAGLALQPAGGPFLATWAPWDIWIVGLLATVVGSVLFAIATIRAGVLSRRAAQALAGSAVVVTTAGLLSMGFVDLPPVTGVAMVVGLAAFAGSWLWLGISALRRGSIRVVAPA